MIFVSSIVLAAVLSQPALADGDIIFHTSKSLQSVAIQQATHSRYSHMGLILMRGGKPFVVEASAKVKYTPLNEWIARGDEGIYVVKRLKNASHVLTPAALDNLRAVAATFVGKPYDATFEWSDQRIYCSELVWKIYDRALNIDIGSLQTIRDFDLTSPAVRVKLKERYGDNIPMNETVISPAAMFDSPLLRTVDP